MSDDPAVAVPESLSDAVLARASGRACVVSLAGIVVCVLALARSIVAGEGAPPIFAFGIFAFGFTYRSLTRTPSALRRWLALTGNSALSLLLVLRIGILIANPDNRFSSTEIVTQSLACAVGVAVVVVNLRALLLAQARRLHDASVSDQAPSPRDDSDA